jgi:hypothetical protein
MKRLRYGLLIVVAAVIMYALFSTIPMVWVPLFFSFSVYMGSLVFSSIAITRIRLGKGSQSHSDWVIAFPISYVIRSKLASIWNRKKQV